MVLYQLVMGHSMILQSHHQLQGALDVGLAKQALVHMVCSDIQQSHHQLQDALDVGLATQALIHIVRFIIQQSHHQLPDALDVSSATQALVHMGKALQICTMSFAPHTIIFGFQNVSISFNFCLKSYLKVPFTWKKDLPPKYMSLSIFFLLG